MKSNKIQIRFRSESHFEKFAFASESITYAEILKHLAEKKRIEFGEKKSDAVALINIDKNDTEISSGIVDAGSRLIVVRKPEPPQ